MFDFLYKKEPKKEPKKDSELTIDNLNLQDMEKNIDTSVLDRGSRSLKDLFAPTSFDRTDETFIQVGSKYVRSFVLTGYPSMISVGWLDNLFSYDGDMDTAIYIEPADERVALDDLTNKITQLEAQLSTEYEKGNNKYITKLRNDINDLYREREKIEQNTESLFHVQIASNLYCDSKEELDKNTQLLDNRLKSRKITFTPVYLRQDDAYKTVLPFGKTYLPDMFRNLNSGALTACFPFYNSEISHKDGVFIGVNLSTSTPIYLNFFDRNVLNNGNSTVIGQAGSGKSFFISLLTMRSAIKGIKTVIIDPEGEYKRLTRALGGGYIYIAPDSNACINPFDIEEEDILDDVTNEPTGEKIVMVNDKVADILNLIGVMSGGLTQEQRGLISLIIADLYSSRGITEDPKSLYTGKSYFDDETGVFYDGVKKTMPVFSDFHDALKRKAQIPGNECLIELVNSLVMFTKDGVYGMFDRQTSDSLKNFKDAPIVTFDISRLEENILRPIGMYISMSWTWEKFIKKNPKVRKNIVLDEAWMLFNKNMAGHEYTASFVEKASRRIRKRNGALCIASQNFIEFANNEQGKAVLTNAVVNIFLRQNATDIDAVQDTFKLSDGERSFLLGSKRGDLLIKMNGESSVAHVLPFDSEIGLISLNSNNNNNNK